MSPLCYDHKKHTHINCAGRSGSLQSFQMMLQWGRSAAVSAALWLNVSLSWIYIPSRRSHPSPPALPRLLHQGQEHYCWRQTALRTLSECLPSTPPLTCKHTASQTRTCKARAVPLLHALLLSYVRPLSPFNFVFYICAHTDHSLAIPSYPRFSHRPSCAQWTSGFLISAVVNQQG